MGRTGLSLAQIALCNSGADRTGSRVPEKPEAVHLLIYLASGYSYTLWASLARAQMAVVLVIPANLRRTTDIIYQPNVLDHDLSQIATRE